MRKNTFVEIFENNCSFDLIQKMVTECVAFDGFANLIGAKNDIRQARLIRQKYYQHLISFYIKRMYDTLRNSNIHQRRIFLEQIDNIFKIYSDLFATEYRAKFWIKYQDLV